MYFLKLRNSCQLASFSLKKWLLNIDLLVLTIRAENVMQLNRQLATECVCLVGSMCVSSQLSAPCSTGKWFLDWLPGLLCVSCLSYPAPDLSINHTVSKKAPIKLKGGLCYGGNALSGEREREVCCHSSWTSLYLENILLTHWCVMEKHNFSLCLNKGYNWREKHIDPVTDRVD